MYLVSLCCVFRYDECRFAEGCYADCRYADCHYVDCHYAKCRGAHVLRGLTLTNQDATDTLINW